MEGHRLALVSPLFPPSCVVDPDHGENGQRCEGVSIESATINKSPKGSSGEHLRCGMGEGGERGGGWVRRCEGEGNENIVPWGVMSGAF